MKSLILRLEVRETLRQRLTWLVLGMLFAAMLIGGAVGAARVAAEQATLDRVAAEVRDSVVAAKAMTERYGRPAAYEIAQFRDPTDAYGYMYNFLTSYATRPLDPLAALTAGQSDLQPAFVRVNFASVFPDSAYELKSPRILALGAFDLGFVLVYLVPLALIALGGTRLTGEQESGILRMISAQPVAPISVAGAKFGALSLVTVPMITLGTLVALISTGSMASGASVSSVLLLLLLVGLYALFWIAACALTASFWSGAVGALSTLVLGWAAATVLLPALAALVLDISSPSPSRLAYIESSRAVADRIAQDSQAAARWLASRDDLAVINPDAGESSEVVRLASQRLIRAALAKPQRAFDDHAARVEIGSAVLRLASPALVLDDALQRLAGTDSLRQRLFVTEADAYVGTLRDWFEPRVLANIGKQRKCQGCPGRLNFSDYDAVPVFRSANTFPAIVPAALAGLYLAGVTAGIWLLARRRFIRWPI